MVCINWIFVLTKFNAINCNCFELKSKMMLQGRVHGGIFTFFALATNIPITRQPPRQEKQKQQHKSSNKSKQLQNVYTQIMNKDWTD